MSCDALSESSKPVRDSKKALMRAHASPVIRERTNQFLAGVLLYSLIGCCAGCTGDHITVQGADTSTTGASTLFPDGASETTPANVPSPFPIPPPKPMSQEIVKKYFLFATDYPLIPHTRGGAFAGNHFVDPSSGKLAWKAMVCTAADCPGRKPGMPLQQFGMRRANLYPLPDGTTPNLMSDGSGPQACPFCGRSQTIKEYLTPEDESRRAHLGEELQQAYNSRMPGHQAGEAHRSPQEIMEEINSLPRHFLLDKDMDYGPLEAAAQVPFELREP